MSPNARPKRNEASIIEAAAKELLPAVIDWMGGSDNEDEILADLIDAIGFRDDGYEIARELDNYSPDAALVEILDNASHLKWEAHKRAVQEWVEQNAIVLTLTKGTRVCCQRGVGEITELRPTLAQYVVTPSNDPQFKLGGGWIIDAADCTPIEEGASA